MSEPRKIKVLTNLRITEVSAVDRGAGEGCRVLISKRYDDEPTELSVEQRARAEYEGACAIDDQEEIETRKRDDGPDYYDLLTGRTTCAEIYGLDKSTSADGDETEGIVEPPHSKNVVPKKHREISFDLADGTHLKFPNQRALAEWTAIQERIHKSTNSEDHTPMSLDLSSVVKQHGISALCRHFVKSNSSFGVDEHQLVQLATEDAQRRYPTDTPAMAFAKLYEESDELRGAIEVAKSAAFEDAVTAEIERDSREAMEELTRIGKARWGSLSPSQRFARAFETNPELAKRAHRRPGPSTSFAHPTAKAFPRTNVDGVTLAPQSVTETNVDNPEAALAQLRVIGRQRWPSASAARQFLNAVTSAENAALVRAALGPPTGSSPARQ